MARRSLAAALALCLLANGFCFPHMHRRKRADGDNDQSITSEDPPSTTESAVPSTTESAVQSTTEAAAPSDDTPLSNEVVPSFPDDDDDDDDDDFESMNTSSSGDSGSNIFSLLRIAGAILPSSSNSRIQDPADAPSPLWTLKLDILRAVVQFATSLLGMASSAAFSSSAG
ncbi:uncharacterized protein [Epargyreus clarus]|uniref:uncharacterized protein n=1 Tax=Epargyreus clarus TaxID=520877 RepID=UPI003C2C2707